MIYTTNTINTINAIYTIYELREKDPTFKRGREPVRVSYEEFRGAISVSSLWNHMEGSHGIVLPHIRGVEVWGVGLEAYKVSFLWILKSVGCPVEGCPARGKKSGKTEGAFNISTLKVEGDHHAGGDGTITVV